MRKSLREALASYVLGDDGDGDAERHDNIKAVYKKRMERRDTADVTELLKELQQSVSERHFAIMG
jgi:hypothetical protein